MKPNPLSTLHKLFSFLVACVVLSSLQAEKPGFQSVRAATADTACRFGITSPLVSDGYDIASIGIGSYLDWGAVSNPSLPVGVEYIRVLRLRDDIYPQTLANLPSWVQANPGSVWVVGNEPDTVYGNQDALIPEVYAARYFDLATIIRDLDPSALIAFGSIVQPTPIRMRYLDRAWNQLSIEAGSPAEASALIDLWSIHSFILNEQLGSWGTGIPPGFEDDHADAVIITNFADTHSVDIFQQRIIAFRSWMAGKGEREKPLWITEYGSLFPPIDPPDGPDYVNVSDQDTASFMLATFDFMLSAADHQIGHPGDGNQLVQRWFWYSLNEHRYIFGGSIFDPDNEKILTLVGNAFTDYQSNNLAQPDLYPLSLTTVPVSYVSDGTLVNYRLDLTIENALFADASCAQVWIYDGDPDSGGILIAGPVWSSAIQSYYGTGKVSVDWKAVQPLTQHTIYVLVNPVGVSDTNPDNNRTSFIVYTDLPKLIFLPLLHR